MKRSNGMGSVWKCKNLRNPWRAVVTVGRDPFTGDAQRQTLGYFPSRKEAEAAIYAFSETPVNKPNITLAQLFEEWRAAKYGKISKSTQNNYNAAWLRLEPLGKEKMRNIRTAQLQRIVDACPDSTSTKTKIRALATQLWDYAVQNDIVQKNYASYIDINAEAAPEKAFIPHIQRKRIEEMAAAGNEMAQTILILCHTGFRINEFLDLTPFSVIYDEGKPVAFRGGLKTAAGKNRTVPISDRIRPYVVRWLSKGGDHIFCNDKGGRWNVANYRQGFKDTMAGLGLPDLTPHATRHTFVSMAMEKDINKAMLMPIVGHVDEGTTKHYTHAELTTLLQAVNALE